jgi:hypothetical protein
MAVDVVSAKKASYATRMYGLQILLPLCRRRSGAAGEFRTIVESMRWYTHSCLGNPRPFTLMCLACLQSETDKAYEVKADVPGVNKNDIKVSRRPELPLSPPA